jgi:hypothetical protein
MRVNGTDVVVLTQVGELLGFLAGRDLAARCREVRLDVKGKAQSRQKRKKTLTSQSSSRWAGAITCTSEDQYRLAEQNLWAERASLAARIRTITTRLAAPVGDRVGTGKKAVRGYASNSERHAKTVRLQTLTTRLDAVEADLIAGPFMWCGAGKRCCTNAIT